MKISCEAGHGGFGVTPGKRALDGSMYEWDFNDGCVRHFMDELSHYEGIEQLRVDDPTGRRDVSLSERANKVNEFCSEFHASFHGNAGPTSASGVETFIYPGTSGHTKEAAIAVHNHVIRATGRKNRGLKEADFQILRTTKMGSLLLEGGFMTNDEELALMKTDAYRSIVGRAVAAGIVEKYKLKRKAEKPTQTVQAKTNEIRYIYTGGHAYGNLERVHTYLFKAGHGFDVKRGSDGSIVFLVGPYDTGAKNYKDSMVELGKFDKHIKLLTREQAAEWRK